MHVHRRPGAGGYGEAATVRRGDRLGPEALPELIVSVEDVLG